MKKETAQDICFYIIGWCCIAAIIIYYVLNRLFGFDVTNYMLPCTLYTWTGLYCPGCGGTRSIYALLQGNLVQSFCFHPFVPYAVILGGWFMVSQTIERLSKGKIKIALHFRMIYVWIALVLIVVNVIYKNII